MQLSYWYDSILVIVQSKIILLYTNWKSVIINLLSRFVCVSDRNCVLDLDP